MQLLYATSNPAKYTAMRDALQPLGIRLLSLRDMEQAPVAPEEGGSPLENARQKALFYYDHYGIPLFSCDSGLYLENLPQELQPQGQELQREQEPQPGARRECRRPAAPRFPPGSAFRLTGRELPLQVPAQVPAGKFPRQRSCCWDPRPCPGPVPWRVPRSSRS